MFVYKLSCSWVDARVSALIGQEHLISHWGQISFYNEQSRLGGLCFGWFSYLQWISVLDNLMTQTKCCTIYFLRSNLSMFVISLFMIPQKLSVTFINCVTHCSLLMLVLSCLCQGYIAVTRHLCRLWTDADAGSLLWIVTSHWTDQPSPHPATACVCLSPDCT